MRPITVTLYVNDGTPTLDVDQSVESRVVTLGNLAWSIDDELTKLTPSDLTLQIADEDEVVWTWLRTQLQTLQSGVSQLFPPWIVLTVGLDTLFTGTVDLTSIRRPATRIIDLAAQDWSSMLANVSLDGTTRPLPKVARFRGSLDLGLGHAAVSHLTRCEQTKHEVYLPVGVDIQVGDFFTTSLSGVQRFRVDRIWLGYRGSLGLIVVVSDAWNWLSHPGIHDAEISRVASESDELPCYTAISGVLPGNALQLDSVDGLIPGDSLKTVGGSMVDLSDVDTERKEIISTRSISGIKAGTKLYLSSESLGYLVNQDAIQLAKQVAMPYFVDESRFDPTPLARPLFGWIPNRNVLGQDLLHPSDIEPDPSGQIRVICEDGAYTGTIEAGFAPSGPWGLRYVDWSRQLLTPPAAGAMPDDESAISAEMGTRNRVYYTWGWAKVQYVKGTWHGDETIGYRNVWTPTAHLVYTPRTINYPTYCVGYDYTQMRRVVISNPNEGFATFSEQRWDGTAWSAATTGNWPVSGFYPCQMVPMPGLDATTGPVTPQGLAMLALVSDGEHYFFHLIWAGALKTLPVDTAIAAGANLVSTPWGAYLLGPGGYGRITLAGGELAFSWCAVGDLINSMLIPSTFAAIDADSVYCFLRIDYPDPDDQAKLLTETRLLNLMPTPVGGTDPVLFSQRVMPGAPRVARAFRDPSASGRIVGLLGSRLFRISADPPSVIERIRVNTMTGKEALEHIGQFLNAIPIPRGLGRIELVSRFQSGTPTAVVVDETSLDETYLSSNFFSLVRVSAAEDDMLYADVAGSVRGGKALEINGHPALWSEAGCYGMASNLAAFFGVPRRMQHRTWIHEDTDTAPPWESLEPWELITVNGDPTEWHLAGLDYAVIKGEAKVTLLEHV